MWKSLSLVLSVSLLLGGCAMGVKHDYDQKGLDLGAATPATVAIGTLDHRPYIVNGRKPPTFVGLSRGGFGNPFDVTTKSGKPMASDMSGSIAASLKEKGVDATPVELKPALKTEEARAALRAAGKQRSVMITLMEWKADTMMNVGFIYDFNFQVYDSEGNLLASKPQQGRENLGSGGFTPGGGTLVLPRFRRMMEVLFQDPDVVKSLQP